MDVLITGASGVIGRTLAQHLASKGYTLHLTARSLQKLEPLKKELTSSGGEVFAYPLDLADLTQARGVVNDFFAKARRPYAMICNAGNMGALGTFPDTPFESWVQGIHENFLSHAAMIHAFVQRYKEKSLKEGTILVFSGAGVGGDSSFSHMTSYSTAKAALVHFVEAVSPELLPLGITINAIAPGPVLSGMTQQALKAGAQAGEQAQRAEECKNSGGVSPTLAAEAAAYLLGPEARAVTGRLLSARFDMKTVQAGVARISQDSNLYRLRRIDNELFSPKPR